MCSNATKKIVTLPRLFKVRDVRNANKWDANLHLSFERPFQRYLLGSVVGLYQTDTNGERMRNERESLLQVKCILFFERLVQRYLWDVSQRQTKGKSMRNETR